MGKPMAENLQKYLAKNDESLIFNNRTMASGDNLKSLGATPAESFGELVKKSDVVFTMVCDISNPTRYFKDVELT
jgi:3-hydroxyisobutyrate dehydrogenase-like beta-hydroxyacid dehydrogenase